MNQAQAPDDRRPLRIDRAKRADDVDAVGLREPQIDDDEIDAGRVGFDARHEFVAVGDRDRGVARTFERRLEPVAHKRRVIRDNHRLGCSCPGFGGSGGHVVSIGYAL